MNFYVDSGGVILAVDPERVFQGSAMANTIRFIGAFPSNASVTVTYILPDGTQMQPQLMTFNKELSGVISAEKGVTLSIWEQNIGVRFETQAGGGVQAVPDYTVLSQVGKVGVVFTVSQANASGVGITQATARSSFICEKGKSLSMPSEAFDDYESLLNQILAQLSSVLQGLDEKVNRSGDTMTGELSIWDEDKICRTDLPGYAVDVFNTDARRYSSFEVGRIVNVSEDQENDFRAELLLPEQSGTLALESDLDAVVDELRSEIATVEDAAVQKSQVGQPNGVAPLDDGAKIPSEYLPSYVDDVIEFSVFVYGADWLERTLEKPIGTLVFCSADAEDLEGGEESPYYQKFLLNTDGTREGLQIIAPEKGKIYVNTYSGKIYRWSGSGLFEISVLKLGETSNTAYPGDKGKANADAIAELQAFLNDVPELNSTATPFLISKKDETGARRATIVLGEEYTDKTTGKVSYEAGIQSELVDIKAYEIDENGNKTTKAGVSVKNDGTVRIKGELCDANGNPLNAQIYEDLSQLKEILDLAEITEVVETTSTYDTRETAGGLTLVPNAPTTVKKVEGSTVACQNFFDGTLLSGYYLYADFTLDTEGSTIFKSLRLKLPAGEYRISFSVPTIIIRAIINGVLTQNTSRTFSTNGGEVGFSFRAEDGTDWKDEYKVWITEGEEEKPYTPYFTGLKSAIFAGIESTNADGTETSTLAFPATDCGLGTTIDFENKKITDYGVELSLNDNANCSFIKYVNGGITYNSVMFYNGLPVPESRASGISTDGTITGDSSYGFNYWWLGISGRTIVWLGVLDSLGFTSGWTDKENPTDEEKNQAIADFKAYLAQRYADGNPVTIRYVSSTLQGETPFTEAQETAGNTYMPSADGTETQLNENAKFGANVTVTQDYDIVNKIGG